MTLVAVVCLCVLFAAMHDFICCFLNVLCLSRDGTRRTVGVLEQSCFRVSSCVFATRFQQFDVKVPHTQRICTATVPLPLPLCHCHCVTATVPHCTARTTM